MTQDSSTIADITYSVTSATGQIVNNKFPAEPAEEVPEKKVKKPKKAKPQPPLDVENQTITTQTEEDFTESSINGVSYTCDV